MPRRSGSWGTLVERSEHVTQVGMVLGRTKGALGSARTEDARTIRDGIVPTLRVNLSLLARADERAKNYQTRAGALHAKCVAMSHTAVSPSQLPLVGLSIIDSRSATMSSSKTETNTRHKQPCTVDECQILRQRQAVGGRRNILFQPGARAPCSCPCRA